MTMEVMNEQGTRNTRATNTTTMSIFIDAMKKLFVLAKEYKPDTIIVTQSHMVASYCRRSVYDSYKWTLTGGYIDAGFIDYVKSKNMYLHNLFASPLTVTDYQGVAVDATHLFATISGYLPGGAIKASWSGWVGDLIQSIEDIVKRLVGADFVNDYDELVRVANNYFFSDAGCFSIGDITADIDAEAIALEIKNSVSIDRAIENYYSNKASSRYSNFINLHGGNNWQFDNYVYSEFGFLLYTAYGFTPTDTQKGAIIGSFTNRLRRPM